MPSKVWALYAQYDNFKPAEKDLAVSHMYTGTQWLRNKISAAKLVAQCIIYLFRV
jgi:hypothetical protein